MRLLKVLILALVLIPLASVAQESETAPRVALETSAGTIVIELFQERAPGSVANFLEYVDSGFYSGTIFHRVIDGFMVQGGGYTADMKLKPTRGGITNEADNGLKNLKGTVAMARKPDAHSATAQFFINDADNAFLDHTSKDARGWGYAVFGRVVEGMDVVEAISAVRTGRKGGMTDVPVDTVTIQQVVRVGS